MGTVVGQNNIMRRNVLPLPGIELLSVRRCPAGSQPSIFLYSKCISFSIQAWTGPECSRSVEAPRFHDNRHMKVDNVSPTYWPPLPLRKYFWFLYLWKAEDISMSIGSRTRDLSGLYWSALIRVKVRCEILLQIVLLSVVVRRYQYVNNVFISSVLNVVLWVFKTSWFDALLQKL